MNSGSLCPAQGAVGGAGQIIHKAYKVPGLKVLPPHGGEGGKQSSPQRQLTEAAWGVTALQWDQASGAPSCLRGQRKEEVGWQKSVIGI